MVASAALVDSNVFISLLRRGDDPLRWLEPRLDDIYTCGMVRLEVLRGVKSPQQRDEIGGFFNVLCNIPTDDRLWEDAAELEWELDRDGKTIPAQDILIAACAMRAGVPVLTADTHFDLVPGLPVIRFSA